MQKNVRAKDMGRLGAIVLFLLFSATVSLATAEEKRYDLRVSYVSQDQNPFGCAHPLVLSSHHRAHAMPVCSPDLNAETFLATEHAMAINGSIPAPTLRFRLGDEAVIVVHNDMDVPTTLHWHGILVPWQQDGPQFFNTRIIEPQSSHTFRFPIRHTGTYWYHSHTNLQEQRGLYGAIVIEEDPPLYNVDHDIDLVLSDWTNENPRQVLNNLKKNGHFYAYKKNFLPSLSGAIAHDSLDDYLQNQWARMEPMDLADVGYDAFLINGRSHSVLEGIHPGQMVRFRIINAGASTYFYFNIGHFRNFTIISKDGIPVQPVIVNELLLGMGETYDILFRIPQTRTTNHASSPHHHLNKSSGHINKNNELQMGPAFEVRATAQDLSGHATLVLGTGETEPATSKELPNPYVMNHGNDHEHSQPAHALSPRHMHEGHVMPSPHAETHAMAHRASYEMLRSPQPTKFADNLIRASVIDLELSGDMERYTWYINDKPFSEDKYIEIKENEVITFKITNTTMMHHPMHLHGHFFRVDMGQGDHAPLFHTVDLPPMGEITMEFHANEPGIWFLHCHNLYHMKMGMSRLVKYEGFEPIAALKADEEKWNSSIIHDNDIFWRGGEASIFIPNKIEIQSGFHMGRWDFDIELKNYFDTQSSTSVHTGSHTHASSNEHKLKMGFRRYFGRFFSIGPGAVFSGHTKEPFYNFYRNTPFDIQAFGALSLTYTLPGNIETETYITHTGGVLLEIEKSLPLTSRIELVPKIEWHYQDHFDWSLNLDLYYNINRFFGIGGNLRQQKEKSLSAGGGMRLHF